MRGLKAQKDEEARLKRISMSVTTIYGMAIRKAETTTDTSYQHMLGPTLYRNQVAPEIIFYRENMPDIIANLESLFPGCTVTHTTLTRGHDGKMYDISKMDEKVIPFVNMQENQESIVINWS
jgi:hypothetical protein